jgi:uncharacterized membrane protein
MKAYNYRFLAREALRGKWKVAILASFLAGLLGGGGASMANFNFNYSESSSGSNIPAGDNSVDALKNVLTPETIGIFFGVFAFVFVLALVFGIAFAILGSIVGTGYAKFNLDLVDYHPFPEVRTLFSYFSNWKKIAGANLLSGLYISLWSLLFFVPGIIAVYNYAMVRYIQAENPEMPARNVLAYSKALMYGNRWRLFCLKMSFFGWTLLCVLSFGIGFLWLAPYQSAAMAAFYRDISSTRKAPETPTPQPEFL